jgi:hypothetical protein
MGFLQRLVEKYETAKHHRADREGFRKQLLAAVSDGVLTDEEIDQLESLKSTLGISPDEIRKMRVKAYEAAFRAVKSDGAVTAGEEQELQRIQLALSIPDSELVSTRQELARLRLITEIQIGNLPSVRVPTLILQKAEEAHWAEPASLIEERVVGRRYVGGSHGVSFRIAKGISYRVGASRGQLIVDKANVPVSSGDLILTNKRIVFRGDKKSFNYRLDKLLDVQLYSDGLLLTDSAGKPRLVNFQSSRNSDIVGSILTQTINRFVGAS